MTQQQKLNLILHRLLADLSNDLPHSEIYRQLLVMLRDVIPCDAIALLRLQGRFLLPVAVDGLSMDTMGRRFDISAHPRFDKLLACDGGFLFEPNSELPDPYDGLVTGCNENLQVHDCMGCPIRIKGSLWGLLTLDALKSGCFNAINIGLLNSFADIISSVVSILHKQVRLPHPGALVAHDLRISVPEGIPDKTGTSESYRQMNSEINLVAPSDFTVLITGETGVGKELVAQELHNLSSRSDKNMISINCAALPENLFESELFGHVKGAFSGAIENRKGKFELADGGTLFLDEIAELPLPLQAKLLRVIQNGQLQRVGSDREIYVNVRLIVATNRNLAQEVEAGRFRADLYHRVSVYPLHVPSLRERGSDVILLAGRFLEELRAKSGLRGLGLTPCAQQALLNYDWPGNIRELEHLIGRSTLKGLGRYFQQGKRLGILSLTAQDLDLVEPIDKHRISCGGLAATSKTTALPPEVGLRAAVDEFQRRIISASLVRHDGNASRAARELHMDRTNLNRLMKRLDIENVSLPGRPRGRERF